MTYTYNDMNNSFSYVQINSIIFSVQKKTIFLVIFFNSSAILQTAIQNQCVEIMETS